MLCLVNIINTRKVSKKVEVRWSTHYSFPIIVFFFFILTHLLTVLHKWSFTRTSHQFLFKKCFYFLLFVWRQIWMKLAATRKNNWFLQFSIQFVCTIFMRKRTWFECYLLVLISKAYIKSRITFSSVILTANLNGQTDI